jgi:cell division initiation protein
MIHLTPLDVRKKSGDFAKALRGYDAEEVDSFLELVSERMEELVKENLQLLEQAERLTEQVSAQEGREKAVQEALVTAQALREDVKQQAHREAELTQREAQAAIDRMVAEGERVLDERKHSLGELERYRLRFLKSFRTLLERELDTVEVEEARTPLEDVAVEIDLGGLAERAEDSDATDADASVDEEVPAEETAEVLVEAEDDVAESAEAEPAPAEAEPAPAEERESASEDDDDSLWLDSLLDGESQDEGRWS